MHYPARRITFALSAFLLVMICLQSLDYVVVAQSIDESQQVRRIIREYVRAMNRKSVEGLVSLYTSRGEFIDESFDTDFSGPDKLRELYNSIFERNPRLSFTAFPWSIDITGEQASVTCSWSLVGDYGVYNGIYWVSMRKTDGEWKIESITAHITVAHYYNPPYVLVQ